MQRVISAMVFALWSGTLTGQNGSVPRKVTRVIVEGRVSMLRLSTRFTTTVRLPEPVSSVVVGDPSLFQAEHSANEPLLVFVKPATAAATETNLLITTTTGHQFLFVLENDRGVNGSDSAVDLLVMCRRGSTSFLEETYSSSLIGENLGLASMNEEKPKGRSIAEQPLTRLLEEQRTRPLPILEGNHLKVGISQVIERPLQLVVLFTVLNSTHEPSELMSPQIQLAGQVRSGLFKHNSRWTTVEQVPVMDFRLDRRKLNPGVRTEGFVVFQRPPLKQSNQELLLQVADAATVDQPVLVPISFNVKSNPEDRYE